jgi:hypothetical protein
MGLKLELAPEVEKRLKRTATRAGVSSEKMAAVAIKHYLESADRPLPENPSEADLLEAINEGFPEPFWLRFDQLTEKRDDGTILADELAELIEMCESLEYAAARRLKHLIALAQRRNTNVRSLMDELGLKPRDAKASSI